MSNDRQQLAERAELLTGVHGRSPMKWKAIYEVEKVWKADDPRTGYRAGHYEYVRGHTNTVVREGANAFWKRLITKNPTTAANAALSAFSTWSRIGVSISTATATSTQFDLQGSTASRWYGAMTASSYPNHSTNTSSTASMQCQFRAQASTAQANFAWNEWMVFNSTAATNAALNRFVQALGTKSSAATWTFTVTLAFSS